MEKTPRVSIVGATGLVGRTILAKLEERKFPLRELTLFASSRSAGVELSFRGEELEVVPLTREAFLESTDLALASAGRNVSAFLKKWVAGTDKVVVDNSSAFRMDPEVPLVIPEVNPAALASHSGYIANPNCSTIQLVMVLKPILDAFGIKRVVVSTYQSVSGAGQKGIEELSQQTINLLNLRTFKVETFPHQIAFNLIPQIGTFDNLGYTDEEMKAVNETRKILGEPNLPIACTCVRVPTFSCHALSVMVETKKDASVEELRAVLSAFPGVTVIDNPLTHEYPLNLHAVEQDNVFVGRIRKDLAFPACFHMWIVADNVLKGAALNAVQIAEMVVRQ